MSASSATTEFTAAEPHSATAACPAGKTVAFGGFIENGSDTLSVYVSGLERTSDTTVRTTAHTFEPGSIMSIAYCA